MKMRRILLQVFQVFFFSSFIIAVTSENGSDFQDDFDHFLDDGSTWEVFDDDIVCNGPTCSYLSKSNIAVNTHASGHNNVELIVRNNCRGSQCCLNNTEVLYPLESQLSSHDCTVFTSSQIRSNKRHTYGIVRFVTMGPIPRIMGDHDKHERIMVQASACYSMENDIYEQRKVPPVVMGICVSSHDPFFAAVIFQNGNQTHMKKIKLPFNSAKARGFYRIEWRHDSIMWWVNGQVMDIIKSSDNFKMPNGPLYIKAGLVPYVTLEDRMDLALEIRAHLFRVRYQQFENYHDELFVFGENKDTANVVFILILCLVCVLLLLCVIHVGRWILFGELINEPERDGLGQYMILNGGDAGDAL